MVTPALCSNHAAVYIGFPDHPNTARQSFFEPEISVASATPFLSDLIRALRSLKSPVGKVFNDICSRLDTTLFHVAWSKSMVEVHDPMYSSVVTGYREIGPLRDYLSPSHVAVAGADHNETSRMTFGHHNLPLETLFFVLYFFPEVRYQWLSLPLEL